jgi:hypothetical protein
LVACSCTWSSDKYSRQLIMMCIWLGVPKASETSRQCIKTAHQDMGELAVREDNPTGMAAPMG